MELFELTGMSKTACVVLPIGVVGYLVWKGYGRGDSRGSIPMSESKTTEDINAEKAYYDIVPLTNLNVDGEEPIKIRPFKPKYYMTMAIENITLSDLIAMDKTYRSRIQLRRQLIAQHKDEVLGLNDRGHAAVFELYEWLVQTYLPQRFPTIFEISRDSKEEQDQKPRSTLLNKLTHEHLPLIPTSASHALQTLGSHIDTDLLLLMPSQNPSDDSKYRLEAFITCFPSGFRTRSKLGLKLADIHGPVPAYKERLEKSMDRFFAALPVGKIVKRTNWSVTTDKSLFNLKGNHMDVGEVEGKGKNVQEGGNGRGETGDGMEDEGFEIGETVLRCERQTLHRLPRTKAVLFAFKTYQYPVSDLRDEGCGEEMAEAIDGLGKGNSPGMNVYKREVVWGKKVKAYLRGEIDN